MGQGVPSERKGKGGREGAAAAMDPVSKSRSPVSPSAQSHPGQIHLVLKHLQDLRGLAFRFRVRDIADVHQHSRLPDVGQREPERVDQPVRQIRDEA